MATESAVPVPASHLDLLSTHDLRKLIERAIAFA